MSIVHSLRTFVAVARHNPFTTTTERVTLTQAAVSLRVRALKIELCRNLFDRFGHTATLSVHGRALLPQAEHLLGLYDAICIGDEPQTELFGVVAIGVIVSVMRLLTHAVVRPEQAHKGLDVKFVTGKSGELVEQVEADELDGALVIEYLECLSASPVRHPLYIEPLVVVAGRHMRGRAGEVLHTHPFLCLDCAVHTSAPTDRALCKTHIVANEFIEVNSIRMTAELVC